MARALDGPCSGGAERPRGELEPRLHPGREHRRREELRAERASAQPSRLDQTRPAPRERVEHRGATVEVGGLDHPAHEVGRVALDVRPPAVDRERLVRPESDRSRVAPELDPVLANEPFDERGRVDEVASTVEPLEIPQHVEPAAHASDVAAEPELRERPLDPLGAMVEPRRELAHRRSDRTGFAERVAQRGVELRSRRWTHDATTARAPYERARRAGASGRAGAAGTRGSLGQWCARIESRIALRTARRSSFSDRTHSVDRRSGSRSPSTMSRSWRRPNRDCKRRTAGERVPAFFPCSRVRTSVR
jgi:hypothetical protein